MAAPVLIRAQPEPGASELFLNRELSWLRFNERVLEEALSEVNPLLERVAFLSIFASNLDEFFMVRVSGLRQQLEAGVLEAPPDGKTPGEQLAAIRQALLPVLSRADLCWREDLAPKLRSAGVRVLHYGDLKKRQRKLLRRHFDAEISPVLTPLAFDPGHPFPHISSLSINLAVVVKDAEEGELFARLKVPANLPRVLPVLGEAALESASELGLGHAGEGIDLVWIEEVIAANLEPLFPGLEIVDAYAFRVTRDAELEIEEDEAADLLTAMADVVGRRHFGSAIRLEIDSAMPPRIRDILVENLGLAAYQVYTTNTPIGMGDLAELRELDLPDLKYPAFLPSVPAAIAGDQGLFSVMSRRDIVLYHPYDSFSPVVSFVQQAASDPEVLAIKQTLYRTGPNSPIVEALMQARENGKQVSVLVELKARFDEESNIEWARALEHAGVHVVYGVVGLKTHAKMCLVVRRKRDGIRRYVHLATGNYNADTARVYADLGFFTCDAEIAEDVSDLFNSLTGYSRKDRYRKLLVAPVSMREEIVARVEREIDAHARTGEGRLVFKINSLVDKDCILALYRASCEGVRVDLQVRGICCLRPGVPGVSDNITVSSIVGRFLEHSRIYYFHNGGEEELFLGSADLMPRNLDGRVEVLFPIEDGGLKRAIRDRILFVHLADSAKSRRLLSDGSYVRLEPISSEEPLDSQLELLKSAREWGGAE